MKEWKIVLGAVVILWEELEEMVRYFLSKNTILFAELFHVNYKDF